MAAHEARRIDLLDDREPSPTTCLADAARRFRSAAEVGGVIERAFDIGGLGVVVRFAGPALVEPLTAALEHHPPPDPGAPGLTISVWDAATTGVGTPPFPVGARDGGITAAERTREPGPVRIAFLQPQQALYILDRVSGTAYYCAAHAGAMPYWELGAPMLTLLQWWVEDHGRQLVHGAALGNESGGVLLTAPGGSGKSSTALAALSPAVDSCGLRYAGDDYCLVSLDPEPRAYSVYGTGKVSPEQAQRFPDLVAGPLLNGDRVGEDKLVFVVSRRWPGRIVRQFPIRALVVPVIGGGTCRVVPLAAGQALRALAPSTVLQLAGAGGRTFATLAALTRRLPTYALHLAPDPRQAPPVIAALLDRLAGAAA